MMVNFRGILVLLTLHLLLSRNGVSGSIGTESDRDYVPVPVPVTEPEQQLPAVEDRVVTNGQPFQTCGKWTCCSRNNSSNCQEMPACFRLVCNEPGKKFGTCSLKPIACDCSNCS